MRLVFFGNGGFGVLTLRGLALAGHEVVGVFTRRDKPAGRGRGVHATPIRVEARAHQIPVFDADRPNDGAVAGILRELAPDVAVVVAYGHLIGPELLAIPRLGFLNLHASLLPAWRGAAPVPHAILAGDEKTGVTVFRLTPRFDDGDILAMEEELLRPGDTSGAVLARLSIRGGGAVLAALGSLEAGWTSPRPQDHARATAAPRMTKEDGRLVWTSPGLRLERQVRAFQPWPLAHTALPTKRGMTRVNVFALEPIPDVDDDRAPAEAARRGDSARFAAARDADAPPGTILWADDRYGIIIRCGDGTVRLTKVQPEGRTLMTGLEFLRGTKVVLGARLL